MPHPRRIRSGIAPCMVCRPALAGLVLALLALAATSAWCADLSALYASKNPSVVTVTSKGQPAGTGFFVTEHLIATCLHVIKDAPALGFSEQYRDGITPIAKVAAVDADHDLAILYSDKPGPALDVVPPYSLVPGNELASIGSPMGFEKSISQGNFNNLRHDGKTEFLQISVPASHGSSGSPLFNNKGQVVGVMQRVIKPQYGQNLNFAISSKHLLALLDEARAKNPADYLSPQESAKRSYGATPRKNFGAFYAWVDIHGTYCFTVTPPPQASLGRMLTEEEFRQAPVSYMGPAAGGNLKHVPVQGSAAP